MAVLYEGSIYACRHCHQLAYVAQWENECYRAGSKADTIRARLGWVAGIVHGNGGKPKVMDWATFMQLQEVYNAYVNQSLAVVIKRFGKFTS